MRSSLHSVGALDAIEPPVLGVNDGSNCRQQKMGDLASTVARTCWRNPRGMYSYRYG